MTYRCSEALRLSPFSARGSTLRRLAVLLLLVCAAPAAAASDFALRRIAQQQQGSDHSKPHLLLFAQHYNSHCKLLSDHNSRVEAPIISPVSDQLDLHLDLMSCPRSHAVPETSCGWTVTARAPFDASCRTAVVPSPPRSGSSTFAGWAGTLQIPLPPLTGSYDLNLHCEIRSGHEVFHQRIARILHLTYAAPLAAYFPLAPPWVEKASCWGAGFDKDAAPSAVLDAMLIGLYRYGLENWRYGYARKAQGGFIFPGLGEQEFKTTDRRVRCGQRGRCKCIWEAVLSDLRCDFSDCFVFADAFQAVAGIFGILTLAECPDCIITGTEGLGFLTTPEPPSFDRQFPRDVLCPDGAQACPHTYYFGKHNAVLRHPIFYDPTFGRRLGPDPNKVIDSVLKINDQRGIVILKSAHATIQQLSASLYGTWSFYRFLDRTAVHPTPIVASAIDFIAVDFTPPPFPPDALASGVEATVRMRVREAGAYTLYGTLYKEGRLITQHPVWRTENTTHVPIIGQTGDKLTAQLRFSGEDIYRSRQDGPYELRLAAIDEQGNHLSGGIFLTPHYSHERFGERAVEIRRVTHTWIEQATGDESATVALQVDNLLHMRLASPLQLELELTVDGRTIGRASLRCDARCSQPVGAEGRPITLRTTIPVARAIEVPATLTLAIWAAGKSLQPTAGRIVTISPPGEAKP